MWFKNRRAKLRKTERSFDSLGLRSGLTSQNPFNGFVQSFDTSVLYHPPGTTYAPVSPWDAKMASMPLSTTNHSPFPWAFSAPLSSQPVCLPGAGMIPAGASNSYPYVAGASNVHSANASPSSPYLYGNREPYSSLRFRAKQLQSNASSYTYASMTSSRQSLLAPCQYAPYDVTGRLWITRWRCLARPVLFRITIRPKGPSIYDVHKKSRFWPPSTCVHMGRTPSPLWTSTHGRHEIHTVLLKWLVQWHIPDLKLKFCNVRELFYKRKFKFGTVGVYLWPLVYF